MNDAFLKLPLCFVELGYVTNKRVADALVVDAIVVLAPHINEVRCILLIAARRVCSKSSLDLYLDFKVIFN